MSLVALWGSIVASTRKGGQLCMAWVQNLSKEPGLAWFYTVAKILWSIFQGSILCLRKWRSVWFTSELVVPKLHHMPDLFRPPFASCRRFGTSLLSFQLFFTHPQKKYFYATESCRYGLVWHKYCHETCVCADLMFSF
jgi:hypothetical protein